LVMPSTFSLVTSWAQAGDAASHAPAISPAAISNCDLMAILLDK
jgi:hypothetical protein